jgi:hypothetical protein
MDFLEGTDVSVRVLFEVSGKPKIPDTGTVTYTLRGDGGAVILADQPASPAAGANALTISVPAIHNAITARYEKRTILTSFEVADAKHMVITHYRLIPFLNHVVMPADVRNVLGNNASEIADEEVDLVRAYFDVETVLTQATLEASLAGTPAKRKAANNAILYTAAIAVLPSLQLRSAQQQVNGPIGFHRFAKTPDWDRLRRELEGLLADALDVAGDRPIASLPLIVVTTPLDAITGE